MKKLLCVIAAFAAFSSCRPDEEVVPKPDIKSVIGHVFRNESLDEHDNFYRTDLDFNSDTSCIVTRTTVVIMESDTFINDCVMNLYFRPGDLIDIHSGSGCGGYLFYYINDSLHSKYNNGYGDPVFYKLR